jgi:alcohol dehydrogenase class IV
MQAFVWIPHSITAAMLLVRVMRLEKACPSEYTSIAKFFAVRHVGRSYTDVIKVHFRFLCHSCTDSS